MAQPDIHFMPYADTKDEHLTESMCGAEVSSLIDSTFAPRLVTCANCKDTMLEHIHDLQQWEREVMFGHDWARQPLFIEQQIPAAND